MQKSRVTIQASFQAALDTITNQDKREDWDVRLDESKIIYRSNDRTYHRIYQVYKLPVPITDRDFVIDEWNREDYPEKGMYAMYQESLPVHIDPIPEHSSRERGNIIVVGIVFYGRFDAWLNREVTEVFSVSQIDIRGYVP